MGEIYRTTDQTQFDDVDQIVVAEQTPPRQISGVAANIAALVGRFQRGPVDRLFEIGSTQEFLELYGNDDTQSGNLELQNKRFSRLRVARVVATDAVKGTLELDSGATPTLRFDAKYHGVYGNSLSVTVEAGSSGGKKYTIKDNSAGAVLPTEVYDNIEIANVDDQTFAASKLVDAVVLDTAGEPDNLAETALASGSDGTEADADYETGMDLAANDGVANVMWADKQSSTIKDALEQHVLNNPNKMVIIAPDSDTVDPAAAITEVASYRSDRIIYAYPYVETRINGVLKSQSPASWYASILSQLAPQVDPASTEGAQYLAGVNMLKTNLQRADYINFKDAGISALEFDADFGHKVKTGATASLDPALTQVLRRRMADYLQNSIARFLKNYQNNVNSKPNRDLVKSAITNFVKEQQNLGILPKDEDVQDGKPFLVDTDSLNTNDSIAAGFFKIKYQQRIYSAMRFIVLVAEIGQGVVVTEE